MMLSKLLAVFIFKLIFIKLSNFTWLIFLKATEKAIGSPASTVSFIVNLIFGATAPSGTGV